LFFNSNEEENNLEKRESRVNSYYSEYHLDYINTNNEVLKKIGIPDHDGWLKKQGDKYRSWKNRFCILKGATLYYLKSDKVIKDIINFFLHYDILFNVIFDHIRLYKHQK
jgi:hypothetical protein